MQEGMDRVPIDAVIGHLKGGDDRRLLTKEREGALIMVEGVVPLLRTGRKGPVLIMAEDVARVLTRDRGV